MAVKYAKTQRAKKFQSPGHYTTKDRTTIDAADFGDPAHKLFPIVVAADVADAARLIGKAADPDAVKARIIKIAKKKGFPLPASWEEESGARALLPTETRADAASVTTLPFARVTRIDEQNRLVTLRATSEATDSFRTAFAYEASKDAFSRWEQAAGNIREMHAPKAVGRAVQVEYDDASRAIDVTLRISKGAQDTWEKIVDGTLQGGSIGASNVVWQVNQQRVANAPEKIATKYDLVELSLVDNPSNPDCRVLAVRAAGATDILEALDDAPAPAAHPKGMANPANLPPTIAAAMAAAYGDAPDETLSSAPRAATPQEAPMGMNAKNRAREAAQRAAQERALKIRAAGDAAVKAANLTQYAPGRGSFDVFTQQVAAVRGTAEAEAARALPPVMGRFAAPDTAPAAPTETRFDDPAGIIPAPDTAANPASMPETPLAVSLDDQSSASHPLPHVHAHAHTHSDGMTHAHPHSHSHEEHVMRADMPDNAPHAEHAHVYRGGVAYDATLLQQPELLRGTPWQINPIAAATAEAGNVHGTQLVAAKMAKTGTAMMQPQGVGHPVMYNSEDANMLGFAVPVAADPVQATPTDNVTLDPAMFHSGGHRPRVDNVHVKEPMADQDGDHDAAEDETERTEGDKIVGGGLPAFTVPNRDVEATPRMAAADDGGLPAFADLVEELRTALAEHLNLELRYGARLSGDSMDAVHGIRDSALATAQMATAHCGCDECQAHQPVILALMNGEPPDMGDEDDEDEDEDTGAGDDDGMRLQLAETQRQTAEALNMVFGQVQTLATRLATLETQTPYLAAQLSDLTLTLADQQRMQSATVTRAQSAQDAQTQALQTAIIQRMEALAADAAATKALVEQVAAQPVAGNAPLAPWAVPVDKRMGGYYGNAQPESTPEQIRAWIAQRPMEDQIDLAAQLVRPATRK